MSNQPKNSAWTVLITDGLQESAIAILEKASAVQNRPDISPDDLMKALTGVQAIIVRGRTKVTADVFTAAPDLKVVGRAGVGVDNIDLKAAKGKNVVVVNAPQSTTIAVAEHTMALLLSLARQVPLADSGLRRGEWLKKKLEGFELSGKTLGIVGMGRIGSFVAARAAGFGMICVGYDPMLSNDEIAKRGAQPADLANILRRADVLTLHVPLSPETRGMINAEQMSRMKHGAYILCTARGNIIDETALLAALESGQIAGAALDVFATEPVTDSPLVKHPKVVCTPHIAAQTAEAQERAARDIAEEILTVLRGDTPRWRVA
ncbi:MAG TPA: hydroxyacid dehydrogenase [Anaerolineales bacterium]